MTVDAERSDQDRPPTPHPTTIGGMSIESERREVEPIEDIYPFGDEKPEERRGVDWKRVLLIALFIAASVAVAIWYAALYAQPSAA